MPGAVLASGLQSFRAVLLDAGRAAWRPTMLPYQELPPWEDDWRYFVMLAGRGSGKTTAALYHLNEIASRQTLQGRIIAPTIGDAHECVDGPVGLKALNPSIRFIRNDRTVLWPNGSRVLIYGAFTAEDVERLRAGTNSSLDVYDEMAAWVKLKDVLDQATLGLRVGPHPRAIVATTPRPRQALREFLARPRIELRHATTDDNPHTSVDYKMIVHQLFDGSSMGEQEVKGVLLPSVQGALWNPEMIEPHRLPQPPLCSSVVVAVDPAKAATNKSDETGIVVVGRGRPPFDDDREPDHAYVLDDLSGRWSPSEWAEHAYDAVGKWGAEVIVAESNIAGDLVKSNLAGYRQTHQVPAVTVRGSRSKQAKRGRALPIVTLYQQRRVHHVGQAKVGLEGQMYEFKGSGLNEETDDRVDALTLAITELALTWEAVVGRQARVS